MNSEMITLSFDIVIVGSGVSGLYCALKLPSNLKIAILSKKRLNKSNSFLAQGGISTLRSNDDFHDYFEDTMKSGHYENNPEAVSMMILSSPSIIDDLKSYGIQFESRAGQMIFTQEGAHSKARILFHQDETGKEITSKLLNKVHSLENVSLYDYTQMVDLIVSNHRCEGLFANDIKQKKKLRFIASRVILATGGIGGLYKHSTNYSHSTGDAIALARKYNIKLKDLNYVQIHPTTLYSKKKGRRFLISESVRGEGALLLNKDGNRFADELLARDVLTNLIFEQMKKDQQDYVYLSLVPLGIEKIIHHFPHIYSHCLKEGYDITKECIPVSPAQHYLMGGIAINLWGETSMNHLYAIGETACSGVHGKNRLASNSLLESLVFAQRAAQHIKETNIKGT